MKGYVLTERLEALTNGMVHPYLVAGVGVMGFDVKDTVGLSDDGHDLVARFGGGVDIYLAPNVGFYLEVIYLLTTGDVEGLDRRRRYVLKLLGDFDTYVVTPRSVRAAQTSRADLRAFVGDLYHDGVLVFVGFRVVCRF